MRPMPELKLTFDWEDPQGARGAELRATWARFAVRVDDQLVTRVLDERSRSVRDHIYLPLYPLAEWIVTNWWFLHYEARSSRPGYRQRHSLRSIGEGFAWPDLEIQPFGPGAVLEWEATRFSDIPVRFLESGASQVPLDDLRQSLRDLVEAVCSRLSDLDIEGSYLQQEWEAVRDLDPDEEEFCRAAAALGLDPLAGDEDGDEPVLQVHRALAGHPTLEWEFLQAADLRRLRQQLEAVEVARQSLGCGTDDGGFGRLRDLAPATRDAGQPPWEAGYELARRVRCELGVEDRRFESFRQLAAVLSGETGEGETGIEELDSASLFDAAVAASNGSAPRFGLDRRKSRDETRSFALCRAVGEYLARSGDPSADGDGLRIATASQTGHQKRNRAFAAEFLAPSRLLRERIRSSTIGGEEIEELASEFAVSPLLVEHQLQNHGLVEEILR